MSLPSRGEGVGAEHVVFRHVTPRLPVGDIQRSLDFYVRLLGFRAEVLWPADEPDFAIVRRDGVRVGLFTGQRAEPERRGHSQLYIEVDDAAAVHTHLVGVWPIDWGPEVYSYGRREFAVLDPDGTMVIFTEPTDDEPTTAEPDAEDPE